jgi:hypothetical protein
VENSAGSGYKSYRMAGRMRLGSRDRRKARIAMLWVLEKPERLRERKLEWIARVGFWDRRR